MRLDILANKDEFLGPPFAEHTLFLQLVLNPQETIESEIYFCDPEFIVANCMALTSEGVTLWRKTSQPEEPFVQVRPWTLRLKDVTGGFLFSSPSEAALVPLENHFKRDWLRNFRREWATRRAFWTSKPAEFAVECEKAREKLKGIILE